MRTAILAGLAALALSAGCSTNKDELKVEITPFEVSAEKEGMTFRASEVYDGSIRATLGYQNEHDGFVYISAISGLAETPGPERLPFVVDYFNINGAFDKVECPSDDYAGACDAATNAFNEKCKEINCNKIVLDWMKNRQSPESYYF
ncbi:MAG: hypothetical protein WC852_02380 [Candidatus Nanoarchaeia archaeon]|jgi:hypothetical protein